MRILLVTLFLFPFCLFSQDQAFDSFISFGDSLMKRFQYDSAKFHYERALDLADRNNDDDQRSKAREKIRWANEEDINQLLRQLRRSDSLSRVNFIFGVKAEANRLVLVSRNLLEAKQYKMALDTAFAARQQIDTLEEPRPHPQIELAFGEAVQRNLTYSLYSTNQKIYSLEKIPDDSASVLLNREDRSLVKVQFDQLITVYGGIERFGAITAMARSHTGQYAFLAYENNDALLVNLQNEETYTLKTPHTEPIIFAVFSPDDTNILSCSRDNLAKLWDLNLQPAAIFEGHEGNVYGGAFTSYGDRILTRSSDGTVKIWTNKGQFIKSVDIHDNYVHSAVFSPDGTKILTASADFTAKLLESNGSFIKDLSHEGVVIQAVFSKNGQKILTQALDSTIKIWDKEGEPLYTLKHPRQASAFISCEEDKIITGTENGKVFIWENSDQPHFMIDAHDSKIIKIAYAESQKLILTTAAEGISKLWSNTGDLLMTIDLKNTAFVVPSVFSHDEKAILSIIGSSLSICPIPDVAYEMMKKEKREDSQ